MSYAADNAKGLWVVPVAIVFGLVALYGVVYLALGYDRSGEAAWVDRLIVRSRRFVRPWSDKIAFFVQGFAWGSAVVGVTLLLIK